MLSKAEKEDNSALEGTELIYNKLKTYLLSKGVKEIDSIGNDLDTDFHEAIAQMPVNEDSMKNKIIDVVQKGYTMNGKVIRFAKVVMGQ
jgi:molecular chaperone GrpE